MTINARWLGRSALAFLVVLVTALAWAVAPAAHAASDGLAIVVSDTPIEVGNRAALQIPGGAAERGELTVVVLSTFGGAKGAPADKSVWETKTDYTGKTLDIEGPVLRVGDYRVEARFAPARGNAAQKQADASARFSVQTVADRSSQQKAEGSPNVPGLLIALAGILGGLILVGGGVLLFRSLRRRGRRRRSVSAVALEPNDQTFGRGPSD